MKIKTRAAAAIAVLLALVGGVTGCDLVQDGTPPVNEPYNDDPDWARDWNALDRKDQAPVNEGGFTHTNTGVPATGLHDFEFKFTVWDMSDPLNPHTSSVPGALTMAGYDADGIGKRWDGSIGQWVPGTYIAHPWTGGGYSYKATGGLGILRIDASFDTEIQKDWVLYCAAYLDGKKVEEHEVPQTTQPTWGHWEPVRCLVSVTFPPV